MEETTEVFDFSAVAAPSPAPEPVVEEVLVPARDADTDALAAAAKRISALEAQVAALKADLAEARAAAAADTDALEEAEAAAAVPSTRAQRRRRRSGLETRSWVVPAAGLNSHHN